MAQRSSSTELWVSRIQAFLTAQHYCAAVVVRHGAAVSRFLGFLERRHVDITASQASHVTLYLEAERRRFRRRYGRDPHPAGGWRTHRTAAIHLLFRLAQGHWPPPVPPDSPREQFRRYLSDDYRRWLREVRGLSTETLLKNGHAAGRFLEWLGERTDAEAIGQLTPADLDAFLAWRTPGLRRATRTGVCNGLRSFLRYLHAAGYIGRDLALAVTSPPLYRNAAMPSTLTDEQIKIVLAATHKDRTPVGRRDFAILLFLATYGLRAGEITRLRLEDIDWRRERIRITQSKTGVESYLPLMAPVGEALLDYLRRARPKSEHREVFLLVKAPRGPFAKGSHLHPMITRRLQRAGVHVAGKHGAHAFRYARAVSLLRAAVSLKAISDLLGHRSSTSTEVYLKLATDDLRQVGLEVPPEVGP